MTYVDADALLEDARARHKAVLERANRIRSGKAWKRPPRIVSSTRAMAAVRLHLRRRRPG